jgi:hypothetical protein
MADRTTTRWRLFELRNDLLRRLDEAEALDGGLLRLLGDTSAALAAIDAWPPAVNAAAADRVALADDGVEFRLTWYGSADASATVVLDPRRAIALAGQLIAAALRHTAGQ